jgi:hypothetical protein
LATVIVIVNSPVIKVTDFGLKDWDSIHGMGVGYFYHV